MLSSLRQINLVALCGLITIGFTQSEKAFAFDNQIMRILISDTSEVRLRADTGQPLLVRGVGAKELRLSTLKILRQNGVAKISINGGRPLRTLSFSPNSFLSIKSRDKRGIWLGRRRYRGEIRIYKKSNTFKVVNHLDLEKYLGSVVGSEMPKTWPMDALKAQAIAARTYALQQIGKKGLFDIQATEKSQVYLGIESETKQTKKAVDSTRSLVMVYKGKLINAVFHSSSGGQTEDSGDVWKQQLPYLVSVRSEENLSPSYRWTREFNPSQLQTAFPETGGLNQIEVISTSDTGRVLKAKLTGPSGFLNISGKDIRQRLNLKSTLLRFELIPLSSVNQDQRKEQSSSTPPFLPLPSRSLTDSKPEKEIPRTWSFTEFDSKTDKPLNSRESPPLNSLPPIFIGPPPPLLATNQFSLLIKGAGAGHGVGMSQWGAYQLANKGIRYRQILGHYYRGVDIISLAEPQSFEFD